jgi:hypothetical protein
MSRPLPKDRKMEKRKFREFGKKIFSILLGEQVFPKLSKLREISRGSTSVI